MSGSRDILPIDDRQTPTRLESDARQWRIGNFLARTWDYRIGGRRSLRSMSNISFSATAISHGHSMIDHKGNTAAHIGDVI